MNKNPLSCACFFDIENIAINDAMMQKIMTAIEEANMEPEVQMAVFSTQTNNHKTMTCLENHRIRLIPTFGKGKNMADFRITIEIMRVLYERPSIEAFVIVSNDGGFVEIMHEIKNRNKRTMVITLPGKRNVNPLAELADIYLALDGNQNQLQNRPQQYVLSKLEELLEASKHLSGNARKGYIASKIHDTLMKTQSIDESEKQAILTRLKQTGVQYKASSAIMKKLRSAS
jgi:uncharacterized LabA/DUF88 family protein